MNMISANIGNVLGSSIMTALILIVVVFATLVMLSLVIGLFGNLGAQGKTKPAAKPMPAKPVPAPAPTVAPAAPAVIGEDEDEIAAVIAAAVAMMAPAGVTYRVRRITPASGHGRSEWAAAAVRQNTMPF